MARRSDWVDIRTMSDSDQKVTVSGGVPWWFRLINSIDRFLVRFNLSIDGILRQVRPKLIARASLTSLVIMTFVLGSLVLLLNWQDKFTQSDLLINETTIHETAQAKDPLNGYMIPGDPVIRTLDLHSIANEKGISTGNICLIPLGQTRNEKDSRGWVYEFKATTTGQVIGAFKHHRPMNVSSAFWVQERVDPNFIIPPMTLTEITEGEFYTEIGENSWSSTIPIKIRVSNTNGAWAAQSSSSLVAGAVVVDDSGRIVGVIGEGNTVIPSELVLEAVRDYCKLYGKDLTDHVIVDGT